MSQDTFITRPNINLRRIELTLLSRLNQLEVHLQRLNEAQEQLILTIDYLQQTSAPFLVLSYINSGVTPRIKLTGRIPSRPYTRKKEK